MEYMTTVISPDQFLESFVAVSCTGRLTKYPDILRNLRLSNDAYNPLGPLVMLLNDVPQLCPGFKFVATVSGPQHAVVCGLYPAAHAPTAKTEAAASLNTTTADDTPRDRGAGGEALVDVGTDEHSAFQRRDTSKPEDHAKRDYPLTDWSRVELVIDVKHRNDSDPFNHSHNVDRCPPSSLHQTARREILAHAQSVFERQHRTHQFMVLIFSDTARLVYIDRAGMIITSAFNFKTNANPLIEFLGRFARLNAAQRGHDPTATRLSADSVEAQMMRDRASSGPSDYVTKLFKDSLDPDWPWYCLTLRDENDPESKERRFLVGKPNYSSPCLIGRATKGYAALDRDDPDGPLSYLKDTWRVMHPEVRKEGDILKYLHDKKVHYVPTLKCHGDLGQATITQDLWCRYSPTVSPPIYPLRRREHYRLVVEEVGKPLTELDSGYDLVAALICCLRAHKKACRYGIMHCEISAGNISLVPSPKNKDRWHGLLIDWESAKDLTSGTPAARQPTRGGTWQFTSAHALSLLSKPTTLQDELESFLHVLLHASIRFLPHTCPPEHVPHLLFQFFDDAQEPDDGIAFYTCSALKFFSMSTGKIRLPKDPTSSLRILLVEDEVLAHPINTLIYELLRWFEAYYATLQVPARPPLMVDSSLPLSARADTIEEGIDFSDPEDEYAPRPETQPHAPCSSPTHDTTPLRRPTSYNGSKGESADAALAKMLDSHDAMLALLQESVRDCKAWPKKDRCPDRLRSIRCYSPEIDEDLSS